MCAGCFSWCRLHMPWGAKRKSTETKSPQVSANDLCCAISLTHSCIQKLESLSAIVSETTNAKNSMCSRPAISLTSMWIQKLSENSQSVVPTKTDYAMSTVKEVLTLSQSAATVIPVPFLRKATVVALKIIQICEVC